MSIRCHQGMVSLVGLFRWLPEGRDDKAGLEGSLVTLLTGQSKGVRPKHRPGTKDPRGDHLQQAAIMTTEPRMKKNARVRSSTPEDVPWADMPNYGSPALAGCSWFRFLSLFPVTRKVQQARSNGSSRTEGGGRHGRMAQRQELTVPQQASSWMFTSCMSALSLSFIPAS